MAPSMNNQKMTGIKPGKTVSLEENASSKQRTGRAMLLDLNLPQLQNLIKRDPKSYREDFLRQLRHFESSLEILFLDPSSEVKEFSELALFLAHVTYCYPEESKEFPQKLIRLLEQHLLTLHPDIRKSLSQALMLLRSRNMVDQTQVLSLFFQLLRCRDKQLRSSLNQYIISDIKNSNQKCKNNKLNRTIQNHLYSMIMGDDSLDASDVVAKYCLDVCIELYRKQIWNDSKTVNIIAEACFSPYNKVLVTAVKFFLGTDKKEDEEDSDDENVPDMRQLQFRATITKKSKSQRAKMEKAMKVVKRKEKRNERAEAFNFSALHLLNDPQGLAEKLFHRLSKATNGGGNKKNAGDKVSRELNFEVRVMLMNLISRIIGLEKLILLNFYPFLIRYLKPHQQDVTLVLAITAQASHDLVPPDAMDPIIRAIIDNFVTDAFAPEVIAAGINAIREICTRCPLAMEDELLAYLVTFKNHRDKGVLMASRSIIALYREVNPELLPKRERGKAAAMAVSDGQAPVLAYGRERVSTGVDGAELLSKHALDKPEEEDSDGWEVASDQEEDGGSEGEWVNVSSDDEIVVPSDSEFKDESRKRVRKERAKVHLGYKLDKLDVESEEKGIEEEEDAEESDGSVNEDELSEVDDDEMISEEEIEEDEEEIDDDDDNEEDLDESGDEQEEEEAAAETDRGQQQEKPIEMTRILTPADFALLKELKQKSQAEKLSGKRQRDRSPSPSADINVVSTSTIEGYRKKRKQNKEERIASIMEGRKDRPKFGSRKGKEDRGSTTNLEKSKKKNIMMMVHKRAVKNKKKRSMRDRQITQRKHVERLKKQKH